MSKTWRPLSKRDDGAYEALTDGVPDWLRATLMSFVLAQLTTYDVVRGMHDANRLLLLKLERQLRTPLNWQFSGESALESVRLNCYQSEAFFLDVVDFCLKTAPADQTTTVVLLKSDLEEGGSAWTVAVIGEHFALVRRVDPTVKAAADEVISSSGRAGRHLQKAWNHAYGRQPDPSTAYREAVRAVEAIGAPVISPDNRVATLGTMIADIRNAPQKWEVALQPRGGSAMEMVLETLRLLWTSELDRHGTADESVPLHVSLEEAQGAVHLATTLVHWFHSGVVKRKS